MNIVTIGGGKGQSTLLKALRDSSHNITAIVSVMDDGGSSGRLRKEHGMVPPGDLRRNLAALSPDDSLESEWNARDEHGDAIGNLVFLAQYQQHSADLEATLKSLHDKAGIALQNRVLPVSGMPSTLIAEYDDGTTRVVGEANIDVPTHNPQLHVQSLSVEPAVPLYKPAEEAIASAEVVVLTMGDLYTSVIPNLLVTGVTDALAKAQAKAAPLPIVYICNRSTKVGETHGFTTADFVRELSRYLKPARLTHVIADDNSVPAPAGVELVAVQQTANVEWTMVPLATVTTPDEVDGKLAAEALLQLCDSF